MFLPSWFTTLLAVCFWSFAVQAEVQVVDVAFDSDDDFTLEGFVYLPSAEAESVPGVVLVHGSGPNSRDALMLGQNSVFWNTPIPVFKEIAASLAEQGIAVLTYDKRTCSRYNDCYNNTYPFLGPLEYTSVNIFLDDAAATAHFLQNYEAVNSDSVVVAGHSQSGQFLPSILLENPGLLGGITLAGPFRPIQKLLEYQVNFTLDLLDNVFGFSLDEALANFPELQFLIDMKKNVTNIASGDFNVTKEEETSLLIAGALYSFWESWIALADTALEDAANIFQPLLIVNGDMDTNVPVSEAEMWASYLDSVGASDRYQLKNFRCLTHAFNCIDAPDFSQPIDETAISLFVDPRLQVIMGTWIKQLANVTSVSSSTESPSDEGTPTKPGATTSPTPELSSASGNLGPQCYYTRLVIIILMLLQRELKMESRVSVMRNRKWLLLAFRKLYPQSWLGISTAPS